MNGKLKNMTAVGSEVMIFLKNSKEKTKRMNVMSEIIGGQA